MKLNFTHSIHHLRISNLLILATIFVISSCGPSQSEMEDAESGGDLTTTAAARQATAAGNGSGNESDAYPAYPPQENEPSSASSSTEAYPIATLAPPTVSYPGPEDNPTGVLLALDRPIEIGQTTVSGVGPPGLSVIISNITFLGEQLGVDTIGQDGTFSIEVDPIPGGVRIGLTADLAANGFTESDVRPGEGEIGVPRVGYFFDSIVVPPE